MLGHAVRFDGGHKRNAFVADSLAPYVEWVPLCPEVGAGLPTPRPALRLVAGADGLSMRSKAGDDVTFSIRAFSQRALAALRDAGIDGYILKKGSPSCGLERVRVHEGEAVRRDGRGLFAAALLDAFPDLPVEEEGRLQDATLREAFIERVYACRRMSELETSNPTAAQLVSFHSLHKFQLMAHSPHAARTLGRTVAGAATDPSAALVRYGRLFREALAQPANRRRHVNVLHHSLGFFKRVLRSPARADLRAAIDEYGRAEVPLIVPVSLLAHRARAESATYLAKQTYLDPYPRALALRNAI